MACNHCSDTNLWVPSLEHNFCIKVVWYGWNNGIFVSVISKMMSCTFWLVSNLDQETGPFGLPRRRGVLLFDKRLFRWRFFGGGRVDDISHQLGNVWFKKRSNHPVRASTCSRQDTEKCCHGLRTPEGGHLIKQFQKNKLYFMCLSP